MVKVPNTNYQFQKSGKKLTIASIFSLFLSIGVWTLELDLFSHGNEFLSSFNLRLKPIDYRVFKQFFSLMLFYSFFQFCGTKDHKHNPMIISCMKDRGDITWKKKNEFLIQFSRISKNGCLRYQSIIYLLTCDNIL